MTKNNKATIPLGFAEDAPRYHVSELCRRYGVAHGAIERWCRELGVQHAPPPKLTYDIPDDFAEVAPGKTVSDLMRHYHVSHGVIGRWARKSCITLAKDSHEARAARWKAVRERRAGLTPEQVDQMEDEPFRLRDSNWRSWVQEWAPVLQALSISLPSDDGRESASASG